MPVWHSSNVPATMIPQALPVPGAAMRTNRQNFRIVFSAAIAIALGGVFVLALDLLKSIAGQNVAIGFSLFVVTIFTGFLISLWVQVRQR